MIINSNLKISAAGNYVPEKKLTNSDLEKMVDTNDEWIVKRTGIHTRFISAENEFASSLAINAVNDLLANNSVSIKDVEIIIVTAFVPDHLTPSIAALVAGHFGLNSAGTYDLHAACSGFAYGLITANSLITSGQAKKILLISAETPTKVTDYTDRGTCVLFGDAATAFLIENSGDIKPFVSGYGTDGDMAEKVYCSCFSPEVKGVKVPKERTIWQDGRALFNYIAKNISASIKKLLSDARLSVADIDWFVPHSANLRLIDALRERIGFEKNKMLTSIEQFGNTSSSSIPMAILSALKDGRLQRGQKLLIYGFGGGLTHAGAIFEW